MLTFHIKQVFRFNFRNKGRLILAILVIGIAISTMFTLNGLLDVFSKNITTSILDQLPDSDFTITSNKNNYVDNFSTIVSAIEQNDSIVKAVTPRYAINGGIYLNDSQGNTIVVPTVIMAINLTKENEMGLGTLTPNVNSLAVNQCLAVGTFGSQILSQSINGKINVSMLLTPNSPVNITLTIKSQVEQTKKFSSSNQNLIIIDYDTLATFNLSNTATVLLGLFKDHASFYSLNSIDSLNQRGVARGSTIQTIIGFDYTVRLLILQALAASQDALNGQRVLVNLIALIFFILSTILTFSSFNSSFKDLTHEYGIYKSLGLKNRWVFFNAFWNTIVVGSLGILAGFILGFFFINYANSSLGAMNVLISINIETFFTVLGMGVLIILFSGLYPAYIASRKDVLVALDISRSESTDFESRVESYRFKLINTKNIMIGVILSSVGLLLFVILPYIQFAYDQRTLVDILILILISSLMGFIFIISGLLGPLMQKTISWFLTVLFPKIGFATNLLLRKTGNKNSSKSVIFAICLAFIFFINVLVAVSINGAIFALQSQIGADAVIITPQTNGVSYSEEVYNYTSTYSGITAGFTTSNNFFSLIGSSIQLGDNISFNTFTPSVFGVSTNLPNALMNKIISYSGSNFTAIGDNNTVIICGSMAKVFKISVGDSLRLDVISPIQLNEKRYGKTLIVKVVGIMKSLQGIPSISDNIEDAPNAPVFVGKQTWQTIVSTNSGYNDTNHFVFEQQIQRIYIKNDGINLKTFENQIFIRFGNNAYIIDYQERLDSLHRSLRVVSNVLTLILSFSTIIALFAVISSTISFINESKNEIAIMKAIGVKEKQIALIFTLESLIVSLVASFLGSIAGYVTGYLDYYPSSLSTSQPLELVLPPVLIFVTFGLVILFAIMGSYIPARRVYKIDTIQNLKIN